MLVRATDEDGRTLSDGDLRDQLVTLLVAGHDTTATGLSWALERLTRHPAPGKAVQAAEASSAGDPAGDEYLDAVAKEICGSVPWCSTSAASSPSRSSWPDTACPPGSWSCPESVWCTEIAEVYPNADRFDPGPDAWGDAEPVDVVPVRRRQPALPRCDVRDGRDAGGAARVPAPRRVGTTTTSGEAAEGQARDPDPAPEERAFASRPTGRSLQS